MFTRHRVCVNKLMNPPGQKKKTIIDGEMRYRESLSIILSSSTGKCLMALRYVLATEKTELRRERKPSRAETFVTGSISGCYCLSTF